MRALSLVGLVPLLLLGTAPSTSNYIAGDFIQLNDNGAWSWFMDERAIMHEGKLVVGSVRAVGNYRNDTNPDWGNVEVAVYDLASRTARYAVLHRHFQQDDHNNPAFLALPDGRLLAMYTKHGVERRVYYSFSEPHNPAAWEPALEFETPGTDARGLTGVNVTYSNLFRLPSGRILNFFRGVGRGPNYMYSDDTGRTWRYGGRLLAGRGGYSPYLKYAFDGQETIHFVVTDDHPRNYDNSVYHGFIRGDSVYLSDGTHRGALTSDTTVKLAAWDMTKLFAGDPDNVGWVIDLELDATQRPVVVFSVQRDGRGLPRRQGGMDHRFHYGRWDGTAWHVHEIAYAGTRLYPGEDDYTGLAAIDPQDPNVVFISTDADPVTGAPLISGGDNQRHRELFRGVTSDAGKTWTWTPITANSTMDNIRPIVPKWWDRRTAVVWMRGTYSNNHGEWTTAVVATILASARSTPMPTRPDAADVARSLLDALSEADRASAAMAFDSSARTAWNYVPMLRDGVPISRMSAEQRRGLDDLLTTALSEGGLNTAHRIMSHETILRAIEEVEGRANASRRDPGRYYAGVFGTPAADSPWGWRLEGHHLSVNVTRVPGGPQAVAPLFMGANPARVPSGPHTGLRILAEEEDLAGELMRMLPADRRSRAVLSDRTFGDIVTRNDPKARPLQTEGLAVADMAPPERSQLRKLLELYATRLTADAARDQLARIDQAGFGKLHFGWAGSLEIGKAHYYRIHGPTVLVEYDNTQTNANHIHTVWRDLERDFGGDVLRAHYAKHRDHH